MAGQQERSGVRRRDVPSGLPRALGGGGPFLSQKLSHMTDPPGHLTHSVTVSNQNLFKKEKTNKKTLVLFLTCTFPLKTSHLASRLGLV